MFTSSVVMHFLVLRSRFIFQLKTLEEDRISFSTRERVPLPEMEGQLFQERKL